MTTDQKIEWCIEQHRKSNHLYDGYLPYEYHLKMTAAICGKFGAEVERQWNELLIACYGHDLIEDTRVSYNDVKSALGEYVAEIVYAVTNDKGKSRKERAGAKYYEGIRNTEGAQFVKMCDRIANVEYSKMTGSRMFEMYKKENEKFIDSIACNYNEMKAHLISVFYS